MSLAHHEVMGGTLDDDPGLGLERNTLTKMDLKIVPDSLISTEVFDADRLMEESLRADHSISAVGTMNRLPHPDQPNSGFLDEAWFNIAAVFFD
jgi:hypothetical protein